MNIPRNTGAVSVARGARSAVRQGVSTVANSAFVEAGASAAAGGIYGLASAVASTELGAGEAIINGAYGAGMAASATGMAVADKWGTRAALTVPLIRFGFRHGQLCDKAGGFFEDFYGKVLQVATIVPEFCYQILENASREFEGSDNLVGELLSDPIARKAAIPIAVTLGATKLTRMLRNRD